MAIDAKKIDTDITLELDEDEITVAEFTAAFDNFVGLVREVSKSLDASAPREWLVKVYPGSVGVGLYPKPGQSSAALHAVRAAVLDGFDALADGRRPAKFTDKAIGHAKNISKIFERRQRPTSSVRLWSGKNKSVSVKKQVAHEASKLLDPVFEDFGSVEGRLEVVTAHGKLECTIYDPLGDRAIKCELAEHLIPAAVEAFRKRVEVFGRVHYRQDGMAVRVIANQIVKFPSASEVPTVREMRGILKEQHGA
jgi:hypothetical protein